MICTTRVHKLSIVIPFVKLHKISRQNHKNYENDDISSPLHLSSLCLRQFVSVAIIWYLIFLSVSLLAGRFYPSGISFKEVVNILFNISFSDSSLINTNKLHSHQIFSSSQVLGPVLSPCVDRLAHAIELVFGSKQMAKINKQSRKSQITCAWVMAWAKCIEAEWAIYVTTVLSGIRSIASKPKSVC